MTMVINHEKYACPICERHISRPNYKRHVEACKRKTPEIHTTDIGVFKKCRQLWDYTSNIRQNLEPIFWVENFAFGDAIHQALAVYYNSGLVHEKGGQSLLPRMQGSLFLEAIDTQNRSMEEARVAFLKAVDTWYGSIPDDQVNDEIDEKFDEYRALGLSMLDQYQRYAVLEDDFEVLWTERVFHIPLWVPNKSGRGKRLVLYSFRTDGLVRDAHGRLWILEFKTAKDGKPDDTDYLFNDDQVGKYILMLNQLEEVKALGTKIEGVKYRWLKKKIPTPMKELQRGPFLSVDKSRDTTYDMAVEQIKGHHDGKVPNHYRDFLDHLKEKGNRFIGGEPVRRSMKELAMLGDILQYEIADMVNDPSIYRNASKFNCRGCLMFDPCVQKWEGNGDEMELEDSYKQREHKYALEIGGF